jgi:hypothetical protein
MWQALGHVNLFRVVDKPIEMVNDSIRKKKRELYLLSASTKETPVKDDPEKKESVRTKRKELLDEQDKIRQAAIAKANILMRDDDSYLSAEQNCLQQITSLVSRGFSVRPIDLRTQSELAYWDRISATSTPLDNIIGDRLMRVLFVELVSLTQTTFKQHVNSQFAQSHVMKRITNSREMLLFRIAELYKAGGVISTY